MEKKYGDVTNRVGRALEGASVAIYNDGGMLATIYGDDEVTVLANPIITDGLGSFSYKAPDGTYSWVVSHATLVTKTYNDIEHKDAATVANTPQAFMSDAQRMNVYLRLGTIDVTAALQSALTKAQSATGALVRIPAGAYKTTASLTIGGTARIDIKGDGGKSIILPSGLGGAAVFSITGGVSANLSTMSDFAIAPPSSGTAMGIDATGATAWTFSNLELNGLTIGMRFASSYSVTVKDSYIGGCSDSAIRFTGFAHNGVIRDCAIYNCGVGTSKPMIEFTDFGTSNFLIDGCDMEVGYRAIGLKGNTGFAMIGTYVEQISNSVFDMNGTISYAVSLTNANFFGVCGSFVIEYVTDCIIEGNQFYNVPISLGASTSLLRVGHNFKNGTGNELVNRISHSDASDAGTPALIANGFAANIAMGYRSKGTGSHLFATNGGSSTQLEVSGSVTAATNRVVVSGGATGSSETRISAFGTADALAHLKLSAHGAGRVQVEAPLYAAGTCGFQGTLPIAKPSVTGSRGGNAALASLLTQLAAYGLVTDTTTA